MTITYCDDYALGAPSVTLNGATVSLTVSNSSGCAATKTATGTLNMVFGTNTLSSTVCDIKQTYLTPTGPLCTTASRQVSYRTVDVTALNTPLRVAPHSIGQTATFRVQNIGTTTRTYTLTPTCTNTGVSGCPSSLSPVTLNPNDTVRVSISFNTGADPSTGTVNLQAAESSQPANSATATVAVNVGWGAAKPIISVTPTNSDRINPGVCALDCFDIATGYLTPAYYTLDTPRSAYLTYRGTRALPRAIVQLDVSDTSAIRPSQISVQLIDPNGAIVHFAGNKTELYYAAANPMRAVLMDTVVRPTGAYNYKVRITSRWTGSDSTSKTDSATVRVLINNGQDSPYGAGWDVAGVERIYTPSGIGYALLVNGDGTTSYYSGATCTVGTTCTYGSPPSDFSTLRQLASDSVGVRWTRSFRDGSVVTYDAAGRMLAARSRLGATDSVTYSDSSARVTSLIDPLGKAIVFSYAAAGAPKPGSLRTITDPMNRQTVFDVNASNDLATITDVTAIVAYRGTYTNHLLNGSTDRRGGQWTYTASSDGSVKSVLAPTVTANGVSVRPKTTSASPASILLDSVAAGAGTTSRLLPGISPDSILGRSVATSGLITKYLINRFGEPTRIDEPRNNRTTITYDANGLPSQVTGPNSSVILTHGAGGLLTVVTRQSGSDTTVYGTYDLPVRTNANGAQTFYTYDSTYSCLIGARVGAYATKQSVFTCDSQGRRRTATDPQGHRSTTDYDVATGNVSHIMAQSDTTVVSSRNTYIYYDTYGRDSVTIDPLGIKSLVYRDRLNRDTMVVAPKGLTIATHYDSLYVRDVVVAGKQRYRYTTNALGWVTAATDTTGTRSFTYDSTGATISTQNKRGQTTQYSYDAYGRVLVKSLADGRVTRFAYDSADGWMSDSSAESIDTLRSDNRQLLVNARYYRAGHRYEIRYNYAAPSYNYSGGRLDSLDFNRDSVAFPASGESRFHYDSSYAEQHTGLLYGVSEGAIANSRTSLAHNADGLLSEMTFPANTGALLDFTYNGEDNVTTARYNTSALNTPFTKNYGWDDIGRIVSRLNDAQTTGRTFEYDSLGRLTKLQDKTYAAGTCHPDVNLGMVCGSGSSTVTAQSLLSYDVVGNRADSGAVVDPGNRLRALNAVLLDYDLDGNLIRRTVGTRTDTLFWNSENQLDSVRTAAGTVSFGYDGFGRRVRKTLSGVTTRYFYDGAQVYVETDGAGSIKRVYHYYPGTDAPAQMAMGDGSLYVFLRDESGNVVGVMNSSGQVVAQYNYSPFGGLEAGSFDNVPNGENELRFKARVWDAETGLYENRARYYDPTAQRFISEDPIGVAGGANPYVFANNDPIDNADPSGLSMALSDGCSPWAGMECITMGHRDPLEPMSLTEAIQIAIARGPIVLSIGHGPSGNGSGHEPAGGADLNVPSKLQKIAACTDNNKFSSLFEGTGFQGAVEFLEVAAPVSLGGDMLAYKKKLTRAFWQGQGEDYASGMNWAFRRIAKAAGRPRGLQSALTSVGNKITVPLAVLGAFTAGYNASILAQCALGVLE